jgi:F0F1-type ATP synthase membrane subunit b/b'
LTDLTNQLSSNKTQINQYLDLINKAETTIEQARNQRKHMLESLNQEIERNKEILKEKDC